MDEAGVEGEGENPIVEAHYEVARKNRREAPDDATRDLGIVASGQLALHYWIAAFGTLGSYLKEMGMTDAAESMGRSVDEARQADEEHTRIAKQIMSA
jgi:ferritin-like metal-binding protein YciE